MLEEFVRAGHTVLGCGRDRVKVGDLQKQYPAPHDIAVVDVASNDAVQAWAAGLIQRHGAPDLLINNAAVINTNAVLWDVPAEEFSSVIDVNIKGVANLIRHFVPAMVARRAGVIVNFSSGWGRSVDKDVAPYCATKWAIEGLSKALALELPSGMAAVPLNPGIIDTDMLRSCFGDSAGGFPTAAKWARKAVPLLVALSGKDNGQSLTVS